MRHSFCKNLIHSLKKLVVKGRGGGAANYTFFCSANNTQKLFYRRIFDDQTQRCDHKRRVEIMKRLFWLTKKQITPLFIVHR